MATIAEAAAISAQACSTRKTPRQEERRVSRPHTSSENKVKGRTCVSAAIWPEA
jgi:hypothetical protein